MQELRVQLRYRKVVDAEFQDEAGLRLSAPSPKAPGAQAAAAASDS